MQKPQDEQEFYEQWIRDCAEDIINAECPELLAHIMKHATADLARHMTEFKPDWRRWSASMHNLLAMFDQVHLQTPITTTEKIERLNDKYQRSPANHTPPPATF